MNEVRIEQRQQQLEAKLMVAHFKELCSMDICRTDSRYRLLLRTMHDFYTRMITKLNIPVSSIQELKQELFQAFTTKGKEILNTLPQDVAPHLENYKALAAQDIPVRSFSWVGELKAVEPKEHPLIKMSKQELQELYKEKVGEEPKARMSKKDLALKLVKYED